MDNANGTQISVKFKNSVTGEKKLQEYSKQLETIQSMLSGMDKQSILALSSSLKNVSNETKKLTKQTKQATKLFDFGFKTGGLALLSKTLSSLSKTMMKLVGLSASYVENVNLLEVAYANINRETGTFNESIESSSSRIEKYIDKMSEVYGLDESRLTRSFGIFKQLANAMELPAETGEQLSEIMVKMTNDIASLYNLDLNRASNALQSALVGQVRPIRGATGADITEKTLQKTVDQLGLDRSISDLSFVEKRLIMVISLTNQLKVSQGDYARTIESAANQVKIMHEQWERLSRAVGNVFYPILEQVLPWINGILMALTEIFNLLASLMGFSMPDFDYSSLAGVSDIALDLEDEMLGAGEATDQLASKLKGLRSFDKLNVINTPSDKSSSGSGVGGIGAVDPRIMQAFNKAFSEYDDKMDTVKMKALAIRDAIMEWLGFEKIINPLTGETEWKYKGIGKTIENIVKWFKELSPLAKTIVGYLSIMFGSKILTGVTTLVKLLGNTGLFKAVSWLISPFKDLANWITASALTYDNFSDKLTKGVTNWYNNISKMDAFKIALIGVTAGVLGLQSAFKDIDKNGLTFGNFAKAEASILSLSGSLGILFDKLGFLGQYSGPIGMLTGSLIGLGYAIVDGYKSIEEAHKSTTEAGKRMSEELQKAKEHAQDTAESGLVLVERNRELADELDNLVDANGRVKEGYEDRVAFILGQLNSAFGTEYSLVDGMIYKNGELCNSYDDIKKSIEEVIRQKRVELLLRAYEDYYVEALKTRREAMKKIETTQAILNEQQETYAKGAQAVKERYGVSMSELNASIERNKTKIKGLQDTVSEAEDEMLEYENLLKASTSENVNDLDYMLQQYGIQTERQFNKIDIAATTSANNQKKTFQGAYNTIETDADKFTFNIMNKFNGMQFNGIQNNMKKPFDSIFDYINTQGNTKMNEFKNNIETKASYINPTIKFSATFDKNNLKSSLTGTVNGMYDIFNFAGMKPASDRSYVLSKINALAGGGLPQVGQVFVANEKGPELVDQIGGQSFVANQKQIGEFMDKRYGSYSQPLNVTIPVEVGGEKLGTIVLNNLQELAKTNGQPIVIG